MAGVIVCVDSLPVVPQNILGVILIQIHTKDINKSVSSMRGFLDLKVIQ